MKKMAFLFIFCLLLAGCAPSRTAPQAVPSTAAQEETTSAPAQMRITLYLPNDNADGFVTREGDGRARTNAYLAGGVTDVGMDIFSRGLCLPSDNKMTPGQQDVIISVIRSCFE